MNLVRVDAVDTASGEQCARLMVSSEPWITLHRSLDSALAALQDPGKELHAVRAGDDVSAFVLIDFRGPLAGYIQTICVHPDLRGRGMGTALIEWAEQRIFSESPNVFMCVSSFNVRAHRLYERLGYEVVGRFPDFIVRQHDELLLRKTRGPWNEFSAGGRRIKTPSPEHGSAAS
jgi:ribosomal protein S18 acetylase RimI-like enzyme